MKNSEILEHVDYTNLKTTATEEDILNLCKQAKACKTASVCIPPAYISAARSAYPDINICTVIGFPNGYMTTKAKMMEAADAIAKGADELDVVINVGYVKSGKYSEVAEELMRLKRICQDKVLKVIIETCNLTDEEKQMMCKIITETNCDYIKTSTGFGSAGARLEDIELFKKHIGPNVKIKAAGGIRTKEAMEAFLEAGCDRIGASNIDCLID